MLARTGPETSPNTNKFRLAGLHVLTFCESIGARIRVLLGLVSSRSYTSLWTGQRVILELCKQTGWGCLPTGEVSTIKQRVTCTWSQTIIPKI